jgi:hypothetical protein
MGKTISIRFKNNKVSKVSGARSDAERAAAAEWGQAFVDSVSAQPKTPEQDPPREPRPTTDKDES